MKDPGSRVTMKCVTAGNPTPVVIWTLDDLPLPVNDQFTLREYIDKDGTFISYVTLTSVRVEDGGLYKCTAVNKAGEAFHAARLNVNGR